MSNSELIIFICTVGGLLIGIFTVVDRLITIKTSKPILEFNFGVSLTLVRNSSQNTKSSKNKISNLFLGTTIENNSDWGFNCPYLLENTSSLPIKNITIILEYLRRHSFSNEEKIIDTNGSILKITALNNLKRSVRYYRNRIEVRYYIEVLRPGERIEILDPINFSSSSSHSNDLIGGLINHLKKIDAFNDICLIDAIVFSEQCPPISTRIKILWFTANSLDELVKLTSKSVDAFWAGHYPKSGFYFRFANPFKKKRQLYKKEYADLIIPILSKLDMPKNQSFYYWNQVENSEGETVELRMPFFNYYQLTSDITTDEILKHEGFWKI